MQPHRILLIHGIRTQAEWQLAVSRALQDIPASTVIPIRYEYFDVLRFLLPVAFLRRRPVERVRRQIELALRDDPTAEISILAHSFGCSIVGAILRKYPAYSERIRYLALCGSVLPDDFDWGDIRPLKREMILNDCGAFDVFPVLAKTCTWGYGSSGTFGFGSAGVIDRHHRFGHSDFLTPEFARDYWAPFFKSGTVVPGVTDRIERRPLLSLLTVVQPKYVMSLALAVTSVLTLAPCVPLLSCNPPLPPVVSPSAIPTGAMALHVASEPTPTDRPILFMSDPDGDGREDVYAVEPHPDGRMTQLTNVATDAISATVRIRGAEWSPDGQWIAYVSNQNGYENVYAMRPDGTARRRLSSAGPGEKRFHWSSDSRRILLEWLEVDEDTQAQTSLRSLYWLEPTQAGQTEIVTGSRIWNPSWSPDGEQILYAQHIDAEPGLRENAQIHVMRRDGTYKRSLTDDFMHWNQAPSWSPDGNHIAYSSNRDGVNNLMLLDPDTGAATTIFLNCADDFAARWSPDGTRLAVLLDRSPPELRNEHRWMYYDLVVINAMDGSGVFRVTNNDVFEGQVAWSPDGALLAFESGAIDVSTWSLAADTREIFVSDLQRAPVRLTKYGGRKPSWGR